MALNSFTEGQQRQLKANALKWIAERFETPAVWLRGDHTQADSCPLAEMLGRGGYQGVEVFTIRLTYDGEWKANHGEDARPSNPLYPTVRCGPYPELEESASAVHEIACLIDAEWLEQALREKRAQEILKLT